MLDLDKYLEPGKRIKVFYNKGNINNKLIHIRAIVDDQIVYKVWSKKYGWVYKVDSLEWFEYMNKQNNLQRG